MACIDAIVPTAMASRATAVARPPAPWRAAGPRRARGRRTPSARRAKVEADLVLVMPAETVTVRRPAVVELPADMPAYAHTLLRQQQENEELLEVACHEDNADLEEHHPPDFGIAAGLRVVSHAGGAAAEQQRRGERALFVVVEGVGVSGVNLRGRKGDLSVG